jgi:Reverse transcriptase (RNA-dependent DNA polymerase)
MTSKTLERVVARQLIDYLNAAYLPPDVQSAYRAHHKTETAVLKVLAHILRAVDSGDLAAHAMLDLSAAFDTVDHEILFSHLKKSHSLGDVFTICSSLTSAGDSRLFLAEDLNQHRPC